MLVRNTRSRQSMSGLLPRMTCLVLLALFICPFMLRAQHSKRAGYQLLWRIEGPGITTPSYLFGTMHLQERRVFEFSDSVLLALRNAETFAMEVDMDSVMTYMLAPGGPLQDTVNYMRQLFTPQEYSFVDSLVKKKSGVTINQLNVKRLWFLERLLEDEDEVINKTAGSGAKAENIFLDGWLHQKATYLNKPVYSLEKVENQLSFMSAEVSALQKDIFLETIGYNSTDTDRPGDEEIFDARVSFLDSLVKIYHEGDPDKIYTMVGNWEDHGNGPGLHKRNIEMADNLAALVTRKSVFAAVGAAHLSGSGGIIALLKSKGFRVNPVTATFTGVARKERQRLDSVKGYTMNRMADGYSVLFPGVPMAYPIPGMNKSMYMGTADNEAAFALSMDLPHLGKSERELQDMLIENMAAQGKAVIQKTYPINYRNLPGTEAIMLQGKTPFYLRLFIRNNRAFVFMYAAENADSLARKEFFKSVRFYDIVRSASVYDTLKRPALGFSAVIPNDASYVKAEHKGEGRPVEAYSALDDANHVSYVVRVEKMKAGYYNLNDDAALEGIRYVLLRQDSTMQLIDSVTVKNDERSDYQLVYRHQSGYISRMHFISRGNIAYSILCTYDGNNPDSTYWKGFFNNFRILPLKATALTVPYQSPDSSFTVNGPAKFTVYGNDESSTEDWRDVYNVLDTTSYSTYIVTVNRYAAYIQGQPDSLMKAFLYPKDSAYIITSHNKSVVNGLTVYDTELKVAKTTLRCFRRIVVAGHTIFSLSAVVPEEVAGEGRAGQFFASFRPGKKVLADTLRLEDNKLGRFLHDLQGVDSTDYENALQHIYNMEIDSLNKPVVLRALRQPFPLDSTGFTRLRVLRSVTDYSQDSLLDVAVYLFHQLKDTNARINVLKFITALAPDTAIHTALRLALEIPENNHAFSNIFSYRGMNDTLFEKRLPEIITAAAQSGSILQHLVMSTYYDSLWIAPKFTQYKLDGLMPQLLALFERQVAALNAHRTDDEQLPLWKYRVRATGDILSAPGMNVPADQLFSRFLSDSIFQLRAMAARGLMNHSIKVSDKVIKSIVDDNSIAHTFIKTIYDDKQQAQIKRVLTQEIVNKAYVVSYLSDDDYDITDIEQITRIKVKYEKQPAVWLTLYRYRYDAEEGEWIYAFSGPQPADTKQFNLEPELYHRVENPEIIKNKKELNAEAVRAYKEYLEEQKAAAEEQ
ncbi:TraB/GumN family protein [Chitinophaga rhizophila]|uniref:TraB/GumN family protein n=1 Tax=Chitinophaga rhizophila TaxID=2866212 RepID=A0ABS7G870_9BACT|nr:TraB/GumN family protein [Chitinophaga rhizophila]MBW8683857.1 TraB/GumN family protein [Chitinophaga rhizophila]